MSTTTQLLNLASKKMLEQGTEIMPDADLLIYANFVYSDIIKRTFPNKNIKSATITFTNGVGTLPADFGTMYGDAYQNAYSIFPEVSIADFVRQQMPNCVTVEGGTLKVLPTSTATLNIKYYPTWDELTLVQNPEIDSYYHELIIYGILARAYEDLQDEQLSKYYDEKYESKFELKRNAISQYEEDNQRGGQMFNYVPLIGGDSNGGGANYF